MELQPIVKQFNRWARVRCIDLHLQALENIYKRHPSERVAETYLKSNGCHILGRNVRLPFSEVDLIIEKNQQIHLVEVKTEGFHPHFVQRVSLFQKERLERSMLFLSAEMNRRVRVHLITVARGNKIRCFPDFLAD